MYSFSITNTSSLLPLLRVRNAAAKLGRLQAARLLDELVEAEVAVATDMRPLLGRPLGLLLRPIARLRALRVREPVLGQRGSRSAVPAGKRFGRLAQAQTLGVVAHVHLFDVEDGAQLLREGGDVAQPGDEGCSERNNELLMLMSFLNLQIY